MSLSSYEYSPLESSSCIRILILQPSEGFSAPLECSIIHKDRRAVLREFSRTDHYEAVSYFWGDPDFSHKLLCDNGSSVLRITPNVDSLLRHLRKVSKPRHLWVDAICLNQKDNDEKSIQVQLMGEIYHQAKKVHVWLGEADEDIEKVLSFFRASAAIGEKNITSTLVEEELRAIFNSAVKSSVTQFLARPWFERRWVIQEVALSHDTVFQCGKTKIAWHWLADGLNVLKRATEMGFGVNPESTNALENVASIRTNTGKILDLLWEFHSTKCQDPKDRLFDLYGLASDIRRVRGESTEISGGHICSVIDYSGDWVDTYCKFAQSCVEAGYYSTIIRHVVSFGSLAKQNPSWPSWVPNWSKVRQSNGAFLRATGSEQISCFSIGHYPALRVRVGPHGSVSLVFDEQPGHSYASQRLVSVARSIALIERNNSSKSKELVVHAIRLLATAMIEEQLGLGAKLARPELWAAIQEPNYYDDFSIINSLIGQTINILFQFLRGDPVLKSLLPEEHFGSNTPFVSPPARILSLLNKTLDNHSLFHISGNKLGIGPRNVQKGDQVIQMGYQFLNYGIDPSIVLRPLKAPFVTRDFQAMGYGPFQLLGRCFLNNEGFRIISKYYLII